MVVVVKSFFFLSSFDVCVRLPVSFPFDATPEACVRSPCSTVRSSGRCTQPPGNLSSTVLESVWHFMLGGLPKMFTDIVVERRGDVVENCFRSSHAQNKSCGTYISPLVCFSGISLLASASVRCAGERAHAWFVQNYHGEKNGPRMRSTFFLSIFFGDLDTCSPGSLQRAHVVCFSGIDVLGASVGVKVNTPLLVLHVACCNPAACLVCIWHRSLTPGEVRVARLTWQCLV